MKFLLLVITITCLCTSVFAMDFFDKKSLATSTTRKRHSDPSEEPIPTKNSMGTYYPNLGKIEGDFIEHCKELDKNGKACVALLGEAYGERAKKILTKTKNLTVILNDLCEEHFTNIKQWSQKNNFEERLILAPGSFFKLHDNLQIKDYFGKKSIDNKISIEFDAILCPNVFQWLSPSKWISGFCYMHRRLVKNGRLFLLTQRLHSKGPDEDEDEETDKAMMIRYLSPNEDQQQGAELYFRYRLERIMYNLAKLKGYQFFRGYNPPGNTLCPRVRGVLNETTHEVRSIAYYEKSRTYHPTTPNELRKLATDIGFKCIQSENCDGFYIPKAKQEGKSVFPRCLIYLEKQNDQINVQQYTKYLRLAKTTSKEIKQFYTQKHFMLSRMSPYIHIWDELNKKRVRLSPNAFNISQNDPFDLVEEKVFLASATPPQSIPAPVPENQTLSVPTTELRQKKSSSTYAQEQTTNVLLLDTSVKREKTCPCNNCVLF